MRQNTEFTMYRDRRQGGRVLAEYLAPRHDHPVGVGVPRGGVVVADEVARLIGGDLDVIVAKKLGAPGQPELALGAVAADGTAFLNDELIAMLGVPQDWLASEVQTQWRAAERRERDLRGVRPAIPLEGRTVLVVDDGLATGATVRAAVRSVIRRRPALVIAAAPVGSTEACAGLRLEADQVICPMELPHLDAIGFHYLDFLPVSDAEVRRLLAARVEHEAVGAAAGRPAPHKERL